MIPLEDNVGDIIGKAQRGLGVSNDALVRQAGITAAQLRSLKACEFSEEPLRKVASVLRLGGDQLVKIACGAWYPEKTPTFDGFAMFTTAFGSMTVNSYLVWDPESRKAVAFDTGADALPVLAEMRRRALSLELILITHAHVDHVVELAKLQAAARAPAWINARDADEEDFPKAGVETFATGQSFVLGKLRMETLLTSGHSPGQTTYVVRGLGQALAIVGDSLFAGSMGGSATGYADQLRNNRAQILTLPPETILACGHGPLTTVREEAANNPFFNG